MPLLPLDDEDDDDVSFPVQTPVDKLATSPVYESNDVTVPLIIDVEGEPWEVDYYNQLLTSNESPKALDLGLDPTLQQYIHVLAFRVSVTDELSSNVDASTGTTTVTGSGIIYPNTVIPHIGDMFVGKMDMGFAGVFTITSVTRTSFYKQSAYQIDYRLWDQLDNDIKDNLASKVVDDKYFDKYRLLAGMAPLVSYGTANKEVHYKQSIRRCLDMLYETYYDEAKQTLLIKDGESTIYDPWAISFFNSIVDKKARGTLPQPREYFMGVDQPLNKPTLWRSILRSDCNGLQYLYPRHFNRISAKGLSTTFIQSSIVHTGIDYVLIPEGWVSPAVDIANEAYVLTHAFYDNDVANLSVLEKSVLTVINKERVIDSVLNILLDEINTKSNIDLFYHLILLISILTIRLHEG